MLKKLNDFLSGLPMTVVSGLFLLLDLIPHLKGEEYSLLPFDAAWLSVIISGIPMAYLAIWRIVHNKGISKISSALLITIAMIAAIAIGDIFAAGEVAFIMAIGAILEEATTNRAKKGLKNLISLTPVKARKIINSEVETVPTETIVKGDYLRILPGEIVPVDGKIIKGSTSLDQSAMTGEFLPVDKGVGDLVYSGTINCHGTIDIMAVKVGEDSSIQRLIKLIKESESKQAPMQRTADRWASYLVPVALLIALASYIFTKNITTAVTVLVVFCPCALVLATPTAIMAAIGQATKKGIIIKSGDALERMDKIDTVAFDKTGTLTYGKLSVSDVVPADERVSLTDLLTLTSSVEAHSEHPLAKAIVDYAKEMNISSLDVKDFKMISGKGVRAQVSDCDVICGNEKFIRENNIVIPHNIKDTLNTFSTQGKAVVLTARDNKLMGIISLSDVIRPEAKALVDSLKNQSIRVALLTGDNPRAAEYFAQRTGIENIHSSLLPEDKLTIINSMQSDNSKVCMIGDGVNDAPSLKNAYVSIAMAKIGSDIAVDAADIALISDDISKISYLIKLSRATVTTIKLSISLSMLINFTAIILSLLGVLTPTTGALVHNAGSCFVVLIAALLYERKFD